MKSTFVALAMLSASVYGEFTLECYPELGDESNKIDVSINYKSNEASLTLKGEEIVHASFSEDGDVFEYGEGSTLTIHVNDKKKITLQNNYDELVMDIKALGLNLSDTTYMCD